MIGKQMAVRRPRVLDSDLNEVRRLNPQMQSIGLNITPPSTASLVLDDGSSVEVRTYVELYNAKGSVGIFRVNRPEESYGSGERISMEHGICVLDDAIVPGQGTIKGTPREVLERIISHQTTTARGQYMWTLGEVEGAQGEIAVDHDGTKTLEMLCRAVNAMDGCMLALDQSAFPWVLHVVKKPQEASCEGRLSRNIRTIRKAVDDADLCTRLYCSLLDSGYIESDTVSAWGVVEKEITLNDDMPKDKAEAYCRRYLENRKNPTIAVELDADEWFTMTGERLDRFEVGDICRLALPGYGVTINERIVAINYADALGRPEAATVSIANQIVDMSIRTEEVKKRVDGLQSTSIGYGNRFRESEKNLTNLKAQQDDFKVIQEKMTHWFSTVEVDLDATEEAAIFGALASYEQITAADTRISAAELILHGDPATAKAGLVSRVAVNEEATEELSMSFVVLKNTTEQAYASLGAQLGDAEARITATATELGTRIDLKADKTFVERLIAEEIEAVITDVHASIADVVTTNTLNVLNRANFTTGSISYGGSVVSKTTLPIVTDFTQALGEGAQTQEYTLLTVA